MPTERFLRLPKEKIEAIRIAAVKEFMRVPLEEASINRIVHDADISRGSFYTYFEDKDDLLRYMLRGVREQFRERAMALLDEMGSPFAVCIQMLREWMEKGTDQIIYKIHQNLLADISVANQNQIFGLRGFMMKEEPYRRL